MNYPFSYILEETRSYSTSLRLPLEESSGLHFAPENRLGRRCARSLYREREDPEVSGYVVVAQRKHGQSGWRTSPRETALDRKAGQQHWCANEVGRAHGK